MDRQAFGLGQKVTRDTGLGSGQTQFGRRNQGHPELTFGSSVQKLGQRVGNIGFDSLPGNKAHDFVDALGHQRIQSLDQYGRTKIPIVHHQSQWRSGIMISIDPQHAIKYCMRHLFFKEFQGSIHDVVLFG
jgi:hypothetical protein